MGKLNGKSHDAGRSKSLRSRVIDALGDPFHVVNQDCSVVLVSRSCRQWCQALGVQAPQEGHSLWKAFPFLSSAVRDEYRQVFQTGRPMVTEEPTIVGGREVITETHKIPLAGDDGQVECVLTVLRDVTAGRQAEAARRRGDEQLRAIMSSLSETTIVVMDQDGLILSAWIPPEMEARFGRTHDEVRLRRLPEIYIGTTGESRVARIRELFQTGKPVRDEYLADLPGGRFWLESSLSAVRGPDGQVVAVVSFVRDVTAQKQAMAALRESEAKYRFLLENVNDIVYSIDGQGIVTYMSPQVRRYGLQPGEIIGRNFLDFISPEDRQAVGTDAQRSISTGQEFPSQFRILDSQGQAHWFEDLGRVRRDPAGNAVGLSGVLRDITERKFAEEALQQAHGMLLHAREEERRRLSRELHDSLGQAMIAMHMRLGSFRAAAAPFLQAPLLSSLDTMNDACNALIREVRQISYGLFPPTLEQLGLAPALRQLLSICPQAGIEGHLTYPKERESVRFDMDVEVALFRIAQEAVNNALRHACCRQVVVELRHDDGQLLLSVTDDGHGFDPSKPAHTGIGLASIRERAEAVGGQVQVSSGPGGTIIEARVPLPPAAHRAS
jgi:PAS domain S-box-containing protein